MQSPEGRLYLLSCFQMVNLHVDTVLSVCVQLPVSSPHQGSFLSCLDIQLHANLAQAWIDGLFARSAHILDSLQAPAHVRP